MGRDGLGLTGTGTVRVQGHTIICMGTGSTWAEIRCVRGINGWDRRGEGPGLRLRDLHT